MITRTVHSGVVPLQKITIAQGFNDKIRISICRGETGDYVELPLADFIDVVRMGKETLAERGIVS